MLKKFVKENEKNMLDEQWERLCGQDYMGENFKVLYITKNDLDPVYPFIDPILKQIHEISKNE